MNKLSRRHFIAIGAAGSSLLLNPSNSYSRGIISLDVAEKGLVFLFQGDSITDGNRGRNADLNHIMGHGYAFAIASRIAADYPQNNFTFYNRGISGNRVPDLQKRWETDTIALKPDVLSLLVGINDAAAVINGSEFAKDEHEFELGYRFLLEECRRKNPAIIFVLAVPFVYPATKLKANMEKWNIEVGKRAEVVRKLAKEFDAILVDYTGVFDQAVKKMPVEYWIWDGIHPTIAGHELMARQWIKSVSVRLKFLRKYKY